ncbi:hypothetical protein [Leuconostoc sp. S51]
MKQKLNGLSPVQYR